MISKVTDAVSVLKNAECLLTDARRVAVAAREAADDAEEAVIGATRDYVLAKESFARVSMTKNTDPPTQGALDTFWEVARRLGIESHLRAIGLTHTGKTPPT